MSQVAIYIHSRIFHHYHFTVDKIIFGHPNIFAMFCYDSVSDTTMAYLNVYANPNRDCPNALKNTIPTLLAQLYKVSNLCLVQGDFNLHCPYWDDSLDDNPPIAWELIRCLHDKQLSLINDESVPTFFHANNRPQVLDLIWLHDDALNWHGAQVLYDIQGTNIDHKTLTLRIGSQENIALANNHLLRTYIPSGSEEEEQLVFFIFSQLPSWTMPDPVTHAQAMIDAFNDGWSRFSKQGLASYNRWWNDSCLRAKLLYQAHPCNDTRRDFLAQCKFAKKEFFAKKIEEMVKQRKPWEGTNWIKQHQMPKVPQIVHDGRVLNDITQMFDKMHQQFAQSAALPVASDFVESLPQKEQCSWPPFSRLELEEALGTCANASAPGPSHFSWELLKLFMKDNEFKAFFLQMANDIIECGIWPDAFKQSVMVIIPKPKKDDYSKAKSYRPIALLECPGKLISKMIAARLQSDMVLYNIAHLLQFGGLKHHLTLDAGLYITNYINKAREAGLYTTALALDAAQFFPSLHKNTIVQILAKEGFNPLICRLFNNYSDRRSMKYLWNQHFSRDYDVNNGVPQGDPLSPVISVLYMSAMLWQLFPFHEQQDTQCLSYIDDFVLLTSSPRLETNVDWLENDFIRLSRAFNALGITIETSKTELMHFAAKQTRHGPGWRPLCFNTIHSLLPNIELHPTQRNVPTYIIQPCKEWRYLGFYFDPFHLIFVDTPLRL